ncbi:MAG: hypothetical protein IPM63_08175 [Acidobacteriota bacterium]|nr:MAG: hypothetical protein IPM63_08175 [Acidobacteriota bacterium]
MIVPRTHDRLLLAGTLAGAIGILLSRSESATVSSVGLVLAVMGIVSVFAGMAMKIRKGK